MGILKFRRLNLDAVLPTRKTTDSAGYDLCSVEDLILDPGQRIAVRTGLAVAIPEGYYGRIAPRSGIALENGIDVLAGVVDSDFRGEILCLLINLDKSNFSIKVGDRIAQLIIEKIALLTPEWEDDLDATERGEAGFGSTGR